MKKRRKSAPASPALSTVKFSTDRRIILIDQEPLRAAVGRSTRKKIAEIEKLNTALEEFEKTILPAYERWETETIGSLLEEERQLQAKMARLESLISQTGLESLFTGRDPHEIFEEAAREQAEWEEENARWDKDAQDARPREEIDPDAHRDFSDEEREFRAYMRFATGNDPDDYSKREYKKRFKEYQDWKQRREGESASAGRKKEDVPARVKELYRILVRRLHPDTRKSSNNQTVRWLWDDLQDAYASMDVERLESLIALTDLYESGNANRSTLFHLRKVAKQMDRAVRELKARFREACASPAWALWHCDNREAAAAKIRFEMQGRIQKTKRIILELEEEIKIWKRNSPRSKQRKSPPSIPKTKKSPKPTTPQSEPAPPRPRKSSSDSASQGTFDF